jgi:PIN domain nuclease of toxin-antitoxin system
VRYLLDTCAIVWIAADPEKLSRSTSAAVSDPDAEVLVSAVSAAEIACACERGRLELDRHWKTWFRFVVTENGWEVLDVSLRIIEEAWSLPDEFHADPADRVMVATARTMDLVVITGDQRILQYPHVESLC